MLMRASSYSDQPIVAHRFSEAFPLLRLEDSCHADGDHAARRIGLEELRRDDPNLHDRVDHDAIAMSTPADPEAVLDAIKETQEERTSGDAPTS